MALKYGIDLGGTKTELIVLDEQGSELYRNRLPTPHQNYRDILQTIKDLVEEGENVVGSCNRIGIGTPGAISHLTGTMKNSNTVVLNGRHLLKDITNVLNRPVRITNDANCFALSESHGGAADGAAVVFGVILGTGCGSGIVINGKIIDGVNSIAGEWGHNPLPFPHDKDELPGHSCYCGHKGCVETYISGTGFSRDFEYHTGRKLPGKDIMALCNEGDLQATAAFRRYVDRLARSLSVVVNILDPDVIVLGGGMSNIKPLYTLVPPLLADYIFSDSMTTRIVPPKYGDSSGVRGAAWLWNGSD